MAHAFRAHDSLVGDNLSFPNLQLTDYGSIEIQNLINDTLHIVIRRKFRRFDEENYIISI